MDESTNPEMEVVTDSTVSEEVIEDQAEEQVEIESEEEIETDESEDESEEVEEYVELERNGKLYSVPKELEGEFMMQGDYTRKTQDHAEEVKAFKVREAALQKQATEHQEEFEAYADLRAIDQQLEGYRTLDWNSIIDANPAQAQKLQVEQQTLENARNERIRMIEQRVQERTQNQQQENAKLKEQAAAELPRKIKGWNTETKNNLKGYARELGFSEDQISNAFDYYPGQVEILNESYMYRQLQKKAASKPKPTEAKPVKTVKGAKNKAAKNPDDMTTEEWVKWREAELRRKRV